MAEPKAIVALDYASAAEAQSLVQRLVPNRCHLKVGLELYTAAGPEFVRALTARGFSVFLDLKFHDIPNTVAQACRQAAALGVWMLTVHCHGGPEMLRAARAAFADTKHRPLVVGVTVLTSLTADQLSVVGVRDGVDAQVLRLAGLAADCGLDGVVAAPTEAAQLRARFPAPFRIVTPGIRLAGSAGDKTHDGAACAGHPQFAMQALLTRIGITRAEVEPLARPETVLVSILVSVDLAALAARFPRVGAIARFLPNLAAAIGKSPTALAGQGLAGAQRDALTHLATRLGSAEWFENDAHFDLVAALTASGPGFVYRFTDALAAAAAELGMDQAQAGRLAKQVVAGAAALAADSAHPPGELARRVASPGGTTQKGLDVLDEGGAMTDLVRRCLEATRDRERALSQQLGD